MRTQQNSDRSGKPITMPPSIMDRELIDTDLKNVFADLQGMLKSFEKMVTKWCLFMCTSRPSLRRQLLQVRIMSINNIHNSNHDTRMGGREGYSLSVARLRTKGVPFHAVGIYKCRYFTSWHIPKVRELSF